jgi:hypothetical protein
MANTVDRHEGGITFKRVKITSTGGLGGANIIGTTNIEASAVTSAKIATSAVIAAKIGALAVTSAKIATSAVIAAKIGASAVTAAKIGTSAVETAKLQAKAVTVTKVGDGEAGTSLLGAGGQTFLLRRTVAHAAGTSVSAFLKSDHKAKIIDVWIRKILDGAGSTTTVTVQIKTSTGGNVTDAMDIKVAPGVITRAGELSTALTDIAANAILTLRKVGVGGATTGKNHAYEAYILAVKST